MHKYIPESRDRTMKVCHLTSVHPAEDIRIFVKECQSLSNAGYDVSLVVANGHSRTKNGVQIIGVQAFAKNRVIRMLKGTWQVYKKAKELNADIYHFHDPELIPIGLLLKRKGKMVIYDVHEDVPEQVLSKQWIPKRLRRLISNIVKTVEKYASKRFDAIVTATPYINERFLRYNKNSVTVHNFPILNELLDHRNTATKKFDQANLIYIGGITKLRGIHEIAKAIEIVNKDMNVTLTLAGKFSPESLKDELEKTPAWNFINFVGWLTREEVKEYLSKSTLGLVILRPEPRYVVSYPIKLFEYMSAGIPVIASNFPLWKEIVERENCGKCVDPLQPNEIASAIKWFVNHPEEAKKMGENGRKAIEQKYNWEQESKRLLELYRTLQDK
jgi:glycosyltransferase involved in cell wall biosynthesis